MIFVFVEDLTKEAELLVDMYIKRHFRRNLLCHCGGWPTESEIHETWKGREGSANNEVPAGGEFQEQGLHGQG